jgi:hypothetical protein
MPAPTKAQIQAALEAALKTKFKKGQMVDGKFQEVPGELPEAMVDLVDSLATGINQFWTMWQATQVVNTPTGPGNLP